MYAAVARSSKKAFGRPIKAYGGGELGAIEATLAAQRWGLHGSDVHEDRSARTLDDTGDSGSTEGVGDESPSGMSGAAASHTAW